MLSEFFGIAFPHSLLELRTTYNLFEIAPTKTE